MTPPAIQLERPAQTFASDRQVPEQTTSAAEDRPLVGLSRAVPQSTVLIGATVLALAVFAVLVRVLSGSLPLVLLVVAVGVWVALALFYTMVIMALPAGSGAHSVAGGIGAGVYVILNILGLWRSLEGEAPAGIAKATGGLLRGTAGEWFFAMVTSLLLVALLASLGGRVFARRET
jgi:hypothetical protein